MSKSDEIIDKLIKDRQKKAKGRSGRGYSPTPENRQSMQSLIDRIEEKRKRNSQ
jgi:hypothetical protein